MSGEIRVLRFDRAVRHDPAIDAWFMEQPDDLGAIARQWFALMRKCGPDVCELMHDDQPTACIGDAAFAYVDASPRTSMSGSSWVHGSTIRAACCRARASSCAM